MKKLFLSILLAASVSMAVAKDVYCVLTVKCVKSDAYNYEVWADYGKNQESVVPKELKTPFVKSLAQVFNAMAIHDWQVVSVNNSLAQQYVIIFVKHDDTDNDKEEQ